MPGRLLSVLILTLLMTSCAGSLFKVKPVVELPPMSGNVRSASAGSVTINALPILSDEETQDLFEANVLLAGVLPVRTELVFETGVPVEIKRARFRLRDGQGREWKMLAPKAAAAAIMKANEIFLYNPHSRKTFEQDLASYGLDTKTTLSESNRHARGFLFFQSPDKSPVPTTASYVLTVEKLAQIAEIKLN